MVSLKVKVYTILLLCYLFSSGLKIFYFMNSQNYKTKRTEFCIETMDLEFLRIKVDLNQKKLKSRFNKFQENKLKIIIQCNLKVVHYLNVNFNLTDSYCCPFSKINNEMNYFDNRSNHHLFIIKQLPLSDKRHLCNLSWNEKIFSDSITTYQELRIKSVHNHKLKY